MSRREATIYVDALRAATWILDNVDAGNPLGRRIHDRMLALCEHVAVALADPHADAALHDADEALVRLRVLLRLAHHTAVLREDSFLHVSRELDLVGRQLGGWRRHRAGRAAL